MQYAIIPFLIAAPLTPIINISVTTPSLIYPFDSIDSTDLDHHINLEIAGNISGVESC